jgi:hypothetical protein
VSGSDSGGPSGFPTGGSATDPCESLRLERTLEAPVPGVANLLTGGDLLQVVLRDEQPPLVVAVDQAGRDAGGIVPTGRLIECLRQGFRFEAEVTSRNGGAIRIEVRAAP